MLGHLELLTCTFGKAKIHEPRWLEPTLSRHYQVLFYFFREKQASWTQALKVRIGQCFCRSTVHCSDILFDIVIIMVLKINVT